MAKLVAVCRDEIDFPFERRQIPLSIEDTLTMVMEIPETVISTHYVSEDDLQGFIERYKCLDDKELDIATRERQQNIFSLLSHAVPCVGCRRSVERLFGQLVESGQPALEPLILTSTGTLSIKDTFVKDPKLVYALFYVHGSKLNEMIEAIPKSRRNRRCPLHSLETHKSRPSGSWIDVWDLLSQECRDEVVLIDSDSLLDTLENYLRKHRFCSECKSKVLRAYSILAGDLDGASEKGFCGALYDGLKSCPQDRHIHVLCDTDFIAHLIGRAEPELAGGRRERHAKTLDIAQEEVLTCLGIHLWERLHRLWQKLRAEEQTWQMLFYLGVDSLRKRFEVAVEEKKGISRLEQVVEEISEAERVKEMKREQKRLKKKARRKEKCKCGSPPREASNCKPEKETVNQEEEACVNGSAEEVEAEAEAQVNGHGKCCGEEEDEDPESPDRVRSCRCSDKGMTGRKAVYRYGYCGYMDNVREWLGGNTHVRAECPECSRGDAEDVCKECLLEECVDRGGTSKGEKCKRKKSSKCQALNHEPSKSSTDAIDDEEKRLLQSMGWSLNTSSCQVDVCSSDEDSGISEQDILQFKANQELLSVQRKELREKLQQKFDNMVLKEADSQSSSDALAASLNGITIGLVH